MPNTNDVKKTLSKEKIHDSWISNYRNEDNEKFFVIAFDYIAKKLGTVKKESVLLDMGCGSANHSIRMANYGFNVMAADYSKYIIELADNAIKEHGFSHQIKTQQADLLNLSFDDNTFEYILCWGVLMHIPDINTAISELSRVLKKGGKIVISEVNMHSLEVLTTQLVRPLLKKPHIKCIRKPEGIEVWNKTKSQELLSRKINVKWLIRRFKQEGIVLTDRKSGQFSEVYMRFPNKLFSKSVHKFNNFWFKHISLPSLACSNILIFEKK